MKNNLFLRICSILLAISLVLTGITSVQIILAYAEEVSTDDTNYFNIEQEDSSEVTTIEENGEYTDESGDSFPDAEEPDDPFDYNLACYTPNIEFGRVSQGSFVDQRQFSIVNTGSTTFPITWDQYDASNAFQIETTGQNFFSPGESLPFYVSPKKNLSPGTYSASLVFYSGNDIRQHHTTTVTLSITVEAAKPYVTAVVISPGAVSIPVGKTYSFYATVYGENDYDSSVTWSVLGNTSADTKISSGVLSVSPNENASTLTVIATSNQTPSEIDTATVTLTRSDHVIKLKADPSEGGAIAGAGSVRDGSDMYITASPNNSYSFKGWYEDGNLISDSKQFTLRNVTSDRNIVAKFVRANCRIKTSVNNNNAGTITGSATIPYGSSITINAKAYDGYYFEAFVENNKTISTSKSLELNNVTGDRNITAVFRKSKYNVNVSVYPSDTGKYEGAGQYDKDSKVKLSATAYDGYVFTGWSINGQMVSYDNTYYIDKLQNDVNLVANFMKKEAVTYVLSSGIANEGGAIVPSGSYTAPEGSSVTYNIVPNAGYRILAVAVDGKNIGAVASYTFNNIKTKHSISAAFEKIPETPAKTTPGTTTKNTVKKQENEAKKVEYNDETAAQGALPDQVLVEEEKTDEIVVLEGEDYEEDTYVDVTEEATPSDPSDNYGVLSRYSISEDVARQLIHNRAALPLLRTAYDEGYLQITVNNSYAENQQESNSDEYHANPTLLNFENVIAETLSEEEQIAVLKGAYISFNIDITENSSTLEKSVREQIQKKIGYKPITYFDFQIIKTSDGTSQIITNTNSELEVVIPIPEKYRKNGRRFYILREHNGNVEVLNDVGNSSDSITFRTDKFSEYALAYETVNANKLVLQLIIVVLITLILALICFIALIRYRRHQRRLRKLEKAKA